LRRAAAGDAAGGRTICGPAAAVPVDGTAFSGGTRPSYAAGAGAGLAVGGAGAAVAILGAAETRGAGGIGARAELTVDKRWDNGVGEGEQCGDEQQEDGGKLGGEHFRMFGSEMDPVLCGWRI